GSRLGGPCGELRGRTDRGRRCRRARSGEQSMDLAPYRRQDRHLQSTIAYVLETGAAEGQHRGRRSDRWRRSRLVRRAERQLYWRLSLAAAVGKGYRVADAGAPPPLTPWYDEQARLRDG